MSEILKNIGKTLAKGTAYIALIGGTLAGMNYLLPPNTTPEFEQARIKATTKTLVLHDECLKIIGRDQYNRNSFQGHSKVLEAMGKNPSFTSMQYEPFGVRYFDDHKSETFLSSSEMKKYLTRTNLEDSLK